MSDKTKNDILKELIWVIVLRVFFETFVILGVYLIFLASSNAISNVMQIPNPVRIWGWLWISISGAIAIIWIGLDSARYVQQKSLIFPLLPLLIFLVQTAEALLIEFLLSTLLIFLMLAFHGVTYYQIYFGVVMLIIAFESARRTSKVSTTLYRATLRFISSVKQFASEIKRSWLSIIYWLLTAVFIVVASKLLIQGLIVPFDNQPDTARELFSNVLTLVTAILAIFFTGATLIIQLIVGVYSFKFATVVFRNPINICSMVIIVTIGLGHLALLRYGWNTYLTSLSFYSSIYTILVLVILVGLFIEYIQVPNVVKIVSREIQSYIQGSPRPKRLLGSTLLKTGKVSLFYRIKSFLMEYLLGNRQSPYLTELVSYNQPKTIQKEITERVRPLFAACLKAINDDRREIVLVCLSEINEIHKSYIAKYKDSLYVSDDVLMLLRSQFEIIYDVSVKVTNQQFTSDIVDALILIGKNSLDLTDRDQRDNKHVGTWIDLLGDSVIKSLHLQHTSAQMAACGGMIEIGQGLIKQHAYTSSLYVVADKLHRIGKTVASISHSWPATITQKICYGLLELLTVYVIEARQSSTCHQFYIQVICRHLRDVLEVAYKEQNDNAWNLNNITNSVVNQGLGGNLATVVSLALSNWPEKASRAEYDLLGGVREILFLIRSSLQSAMEKRTAPVDLYCSTLSEIAWTLIRFILRNQEKHARKSAQDDLKLLVQIVEGFFETVSKKYPDHSYESFKELSPIYAFLIYFSRQYNTKEFFEYYVASVKNIMATINKRPKDQDNSQGYRILYSHLKLFGAWFYKFEPKHAFVKLLLETLRRNDTLGYSFDDLGYPTDSIRGEWGIFPSNTWAESGQLIADALNDRKIYYEFDDLISKRKSKKRAKRT